MNSTTVLLCGWFLEDIEYAVLKSMAHQGKKVFRHSADGLGLRKAKRLGLCRIASTIILVGSLLMLLPEEVFGNIGMENVGYGAATVGMGGTGVAAGEDTSVINTNPAALVRLKQGRADLGLEVMVPDFGMRNAFNDTDGEHPVFLIPAGGAARRFSERWVLGLGLFNEGGTGTDYGVLNVDNALLGGSGISEIEHFSNFGLMVLAPAVALQLTDDLAVGLSPQFGYGTLRMKMPLAQPALNRFGAADLEGDALTWRWKVGALWQPQDWLGFGLAYTSAADLDLTGDVTVATPTGGLPGLPPQSLLRGDLEMDIGWPEAYKAGVFFDLRRQGGLLVALEMQRVRWSRYYDTIPVSFRHLNFNGYSQPEQSFAMSIGMDDQTAYRVGVEFPTGDRMSFRAGYIYGRNPVPELGILPVFNPIVEHHLTAGFGYRSPAGFAFNTAAVWGIKNTVRGNANHTVSPDAANTTVDMGFFSLLMQFSYAW